MKNGSTMKLHFKKHDPDLVVDDSLKEFLYSDRQRAWITRTLDSDWPQALMIRQIITHHVSLNLLEGTRPVVLSCLELALLHYSRFLGVKPDSDRFIEFLNCYLTSISKRLEGIEVVCQSRLDRGDGVWKPTYSHSLHDWSTGIQYRHPDAELRVTSSVLAPAAREIYIGLLSKVASSLPESAMTRIRKSIKAG